MSEFFTLHRDLPREGPGEPADVHWALAEAGLAGAVRVIDAACGPGADLVTLAEALPDAQIEGVDLQAHFVAAAQDRVAAFGPRVSVRQGDMAVLDGPADLIWCAGAVYFLGISAALAAWAPVLAPRGHICFSEPVYVTDPPSAAAQRFWSSEGVDVTTRDGLAAKVKAAGFRTVAARTLAPSAWAAYYVPQAARIEALRPGAAPDLARVLEAAAQEFALWRTAPEEITYAQLLVAPV